MLGCGGLRNEKHEKSQLIPGSPITIAFDRQTDLILASNFELIRRGEGHSVKPKPVEETKTLKIHGKEVTLSGQELIDHRAKRAQEERDKKVRGYIRKSRGKPSRLSGSVELK